MKSYKSSLLYFFSMIYSVGAFAIEAKSDKSGTKRVPVSRRVEKLQLNLVKLSKEGKKFKLNAKNSYVRGVGLPCPNEIELSFNANTRDFVLSDLEEDRDLSVAYEGPYKTVKEVGRFQDQGALITHVRFKKLSYTPSPNLFNRLLAGNMAPTLTYAEFNFYDFPRTYPHTEEGFPLRPAIPPTYFPNHPFILKWDNINDTEGTVKVCEFDLIES
jgi:hypothetical protein